MRSDIILSALHNGSKGKSNTTLVIGYNMILYTRGTEMIQTISFVRIQGLSKDYIIAPIIIIFGSQKKCNFPGKNISLSSFL